MWSWRTFRFTKWLFIVYNSWLCLQSLQIQALPQLQHDLWTLRWPLTSANMSDSVCYSFSMGSAQATLLNKSFPVYHQPITHSTITQSDLTINISSLSMSPYKGTLSRRFWRYGERLAWYVLKQVWNQSRCNGTSERVTSRTGSYKACPNEAVTSWLCLHKRSVWNCPCLIWCCLSVLNYSEMASKLLVCAFIPARVI